MYKKKETLSFLREEGKSVQCSRLSNRLDESKSSDIPRAETTGSQTTQLWRGFDARGERLTGAVSRAAAAGRPRRGVVISAVEDRFVSFLFEDLDSESYFCTRSKFAFVFGPTNRQLRHIH